MNHLKKTALRRSREKEKYWKKIAKYGCAALERVSEQRDSLALELEAVREELRKYQERENDL